MVNKMLNENQQLFEMCLKTREAQIKLSEAIELLRKARQLAEEAKNNLSSGNVLSDELRKTFIEMDKKAFEQITGTTALESIAADKYRRASYKMEMFLEEAESVPSFFEVEK